jgi:hypothetical protein
MGAQEESVCIRVHPCPILFFLTLCSLLFYQTDFSSPLGLSNRTITTAA